MNPLRPESFSVYLFAAGLGCGASPAAEEGRETGPCLEGECLGDLVCLSDVCVQGDGSAAEGTSGDSGPQSGGDPNASGDGPADPDGGEGPGGSATGSGPNSGNDSNGDDGDACGTGGLPQGSICDPTLDECEACSRCGGYWGDDGYGGAVLQYRCEPRPSNPIPAGGSCVAPVSPTQFDECADGAACLPANAEWEGRCAPLCADGCATGICLNDYWCVPGCDIRDERPSLPGSEACDPGWACYRAGGGAGQCLPAGVGEFPDGCSLDSECAPGFLCEEGGFGKVCAPVCSVGNDEQCANLSEHPVTFFCQSANDVPTGVGVCGFSFDPCEQSYLICLDQNDPAFCEEELEICQGR